MASPAPKKRVMPAADSPQRIQTSQKKSDSSRVNRGISTFTGLVFIIVLLIAIFTQTHRTYNTYPDVEDKCQLQTAFPASNMFCEKEALEYVKFLSVDVGNRLIGSKALYKSEDYIQQVVRDIMTKSKLNTKVDVELQFQKATGTFLLEKFLGKDLLQAYHNVSNIIVKVNPKGSGQFTEHDMLYTDSYIDHKKEGRNALLVNAHYDSAVGSPGATDDGIPVGVMLALLRNLVTTPSELKAPVILLFNGGEEFGMHAAHGFIAQHPWAHEVRTILNLESCGGGQGRPMLFQAGPGHGYVVKSYQRVSPYPQASVLAQDFIKALPADTDYRVFTKHTNNFAAGVDLAFTRNGFVYHTSQDAYHQIEKGAAQHMGETVFNLVHDLTENYLSKENIDELDEKHEPLFIDFFGLFLIVWDYYHQTVLVASLVLVLFTMLLMRLFSNRKYVDSISYLYAIFHQLAGLVAALLVSLVACLALAAVFILSEKTMRWYVRSWLGVLMYGSITCMISIAVNYAVNTRIRERVLKFASASNWSTYEIAEDTLVWAIHILMLTLTVVSHLLGARSSIVFFLYSVVFSIQTISTFFLQLSPFIRTLVTVVPLATYQMYATMLMLDAGWPFFGRLGGLLNGEILCSLYVCAFIFLNILYVLPTLQNIKRFNILSYASFIVAIVAFVLIIQQNHVFSKDRPRRLAPNHVRYVNSETGIIEKDYLQIGVLDSYEVEPSLSSIFKMTNDNIWSLPDERRDVRDFDAAYPLSDVIRGGIVSLYNNTEVGDVSPVRAQVKVLEEQITEISPSVWNRYLKLHIDTDTKDLGGFTSIKLKSPLLHSWSLNGEIRRDPANANYVYIKLVGDGELTFSVNLRDTVMDESVNVKEHLSLQMDIDTGLSIKDKVLENIETLLRGHEELSILNIQQFNTEWNI